MYDFKFYQACRGRTQPVSLGMEKDLFGSQCVPMGTLSSQVVPNSTSVLSHMVYPKFNSHIYQLKWWAIGSTIVPILRLGVQKEPMGRLSMHT
jgi:hypothetical protein